MALRVEELGEFPIEKNPTSEVLNGRSPIQELEIISNVLSDESLPRGFLHDHIHEPAHSMTVTVENKPVTARVIIHRPSVDPETPAGFFDTVLLTTDGRLLLSEAPTEQLPAVSKRHDPGIAKEHHFSGIGWVDIQANDIPVEYSESLADFTQETIRFRMREMSVVDHAARIIEDATDQLTTKP